MNLADGPKLERISLGGIAYFVDEHCPARIIGNGEIRGNRFKPGISRIEILNEKIQIGFINESYSPNDRGFLSLVNATLREKSMYLSNARYQPSKWWGLLPQRLTGTFYREADKR